MTFVIPILAEWAVVQAFIRGERMLIMLFEECVATILDYDEKEIGESRKSTLGSLVLVWVSL